jgi:DUF4097 and DUF4098 domain-containing protein YvlB
MQTTRLLFAALLVSTSAGAQEIVGRRDRTFSITERLASGGGVNLHTTNGTLTVTEASGMTVDYRAEKIRGDADDIGFVVLRGSNGITICAVYDDDDECTERGIERRRRSSWRNMGDRAKANITVSVPRGTILRATSGNGEVSVAAAVAELRASSGNGKVRVSRVEGRVEASTGNGMVTIDDVGGPVKVSSGNGDVSIGTVRGPVNASTGNGDILARMTRLDGTEDMEFSSGNGRIELTVPENFSAEIDASTGNGRITTDFPIRVVGRIQPTRLRGTIGDGRRRVTMSTGNGSMEIRKTM